MNKENLQRMYDYLVENRDTIEPNFKFEVYRDKEDSWKEPVCNSVGCLIGHGTGAFNITELPLCEEGNIDFNEFGCHVLDIDVLGSTRELWEFLFSGYWSEINPSYEDALNRIKYVLDGNNYYTHKDFNKFIEYLDIEE